MNRLILVVSTLAAVTTACVDEGRPAACGEPAVTFQLQLTAEALTPNDPAACRGQDVTLVVASKIDGIIHIHGYDATVPATEVSANEELRLTFRADRSGQFPIELHPSGDPEGVGIGVFTVHEP